MLCAVPAAQAQPAPYHHYRTLDTPHFSIHVPAGLEREGRVAGAAAERAYALLSRELHTPRGRIDLVVSDDADFSNGYATPIPTNRIVVFATPPVESNALRLNEDWLQLVITHELTHIFHLDRTRGLWRVAQTIFGRGPALFPNSYGPSWLTEGLAVYYESKLTEGGRLKDAEHRLLTRTAAMEHAFPEINELSLGSPVFPGGTRAYAYGSLFVEYLARTYGDSSIGRFVEKQSNTIIPFLLNTDARHAFGLSFEDAYAKWRDTMEKSVATRDTGLAGWRELTHHKYYATDPRWTSDTTLVYSGSDGRSTPGEFSLGLNGDRRRLGRRNTLGGNVPLTDGSLLFAQLEYTGTQEVRSDLYIEKTGTQHRLTKGMRLIQPDVRSDGTIVAVQLDATRSSLILLDSAAHESRLLRFAGPDETWSEPRWSPNGRFVAAIHHLHGGLFSLEVIDIATGASSVLDQGRFIMTSPTWASTGSTIFYTSEKTGYPTLAAASALSTETDSLPTSDIAYSAIDNIFNPEVRMNVRMQLLAASRLRADGFHVGVISPDATQLTAVRPRLVLDTMPVSPQQLAEGEYHSYSAWHTVLPRYWYPIVEDAPGRGTRLGITSDGRDVLNRHIWDGYVAIPTTGMYPTGRFTYRYAGFRQPYLDFNIEQDYTSELELTNGGTGQHAGTLLRRAQYASLSTSFVRPRYRTFSAFGFGAQLERRNFVTDPGQFLVQLDSAYAKEYVFPSVFVSAQWSNLQRPTLSISPEDGIAVGITARDRWRTDIVGASRSYSAVGTLSLYKSLDLPGFAHHVIAARVAGGISDRKSASSFDIGGISGTSIRVLPGYAIGEGRRTFGVRGFPSSASYGTSAASGTLEYRLPVKAMARGWRLLPFFADRSSLTGFFDAGVANCVSNPYVPSACAPANRLGKPIGSVGIEAVQTAAVLDYDTPQNIRVGFAVPVIGRDIVSTNAVSVYLTYGLSF